jgi:hypothetical protein
MQGLALHSGLLVGPCLLMFDVLCSVIKKKQKLFLSNSARYSM